MPACMLPLPGAWCDDCLHCGQAVKVFGKKWARVAEAVPTRNQIQCRERYVNMLDPEVKKREPWTKAEDAVLIQALSECQNDDGSIR